MADPNINESPCTLFLTSRKNSSSVSESNVPSFISRTLDKKLAVLKKVISYACKLEQIESVSIFSKKILFKYDKSNTVVNINFC